MRCRVRVPQGIRTSLLGRPCPVIAELEAEHTFDNPIVTTIER